MPASSRSASSTSAPSRARKYARAQAGQAAADHQHVAAPRLLRQPAAAGADAAAASGSSSSGASNSGASNISGAAGTGRSGARGAANAIVVRRVGAEPRDRGGAEAALAAPHAGARRLLQRRQRGEAARQFLAQAAGGHLLAAADDGVVGQRVGTQADRPEQRPQRILERQRPPQRRPRGRFVRRVQAEVARRRQPGQPAARHGHARAAERRAVADREHARHRGAPVLRPFRSPDGRARHRRSAASRPARAPGRFPAGTRGSARRHPRRSCGRTRGRRHVRSHASVASQFGRRCADHSTGTPARFSVSSMPMPSRTRSGAVRAMVQACASAAGPGRGAASTTASGFTPPASSSQASCRLSGPLPAISTRSPGQTRCARTSVCSAPGGHHAGQRPAGQRHRPLMRAGRQHQPARPERHGAAAHQRGDLVRRQSRPRRWPRSRCARRRPARDRAGRMPRRNCAIGRGIGMAVGKRLGVLPAGGAALVQHHHRCAGLRGGDRRRQPGRPGADHQHVARLVLGLRAVRFVGRAAPAASVGSPVTTMPSATLVMQARWPMRPSTVTTQSKQAPMPQCRPRGAPLAVRR